MKWKRMSASLATLLAGMMLLAGCGNSGDKTDQNSKQDTANLPDTASNSKQDTANLPDTASNRQQDTANLPDTANPQGGWGGLLKVVSNSEEGASVEVLGDDFVPMDAITEEDIKGKSAGTFAGKDYTAYELADGSKILSLDGEGDLNGMNDAIEDFNRQGENQS